MSTPTLVGPQKRFVCKSCNEENYSHAHLINDHNNPHYAKYECVGCGAWHSWCAKPDSARKRRSGAHSDLVARFGRGYCELCLRTPEELRRADTLVGHHVLEFAKSDEPDSSRENVWILCTACHAMVHHTRTYFGHDEPKLEGPCDAE